MAINWFVFVSECQWDGSIQAFPRGPLITLPEIDIS